MKKFKVAVLANLKTNAPKFENMTQDQWDDLDSDHTVQSLVEAIRSGGNDSEFFEGNLAWLINCPSINQIFASIFLKDILETAAKLMFQLCWK